MLFPTGQVADLRDGKISVAIKVFVEGNKIGFKMPDGRKGFYRQLEDFGLKSDKLDLEFRGHHT